MSKKTTRFVLALVIMTLVFAPIVNASSNRLLSMGSRGSDVRALQQRLNSLGYNCGKVDGIFGKRTYNAVKAFQQKNGLAVDGMVGRNTRNKLYSSNNKPSKGGTSIPPITSLLRRGSRGSQVKILQNRLNQLGYDAGNADGIFGSRTYNAVRSFQKAKGLSIDGIVGKNTINKLYEKSSSTPKPKPEQEPTLPSEQIYRVRKSWNDAGSQIGAFKNLANAKKIVDNNPEYKVFDLSGKIIYENEPEPTLPSEQMYRVRKSWNDAGSQIGAFKNLASAKKLVDDNPGYKVFDLSGKIIYEKELIINPEPENPVFEVPILSETNTTVEQMQNWARNKNATETFISLAPIYFNIATEIGVNPEGAYSQAAHETGYGRFGGVIDETYCNPCGLKTTEGGNDNDPSAHKRFKSWDEGVRAHIDHLALYAGAPGYPKQNSPDPRHFSYLSGRATTFKSLGGYGKWAPSIEYGIRLERLLNEIYNTSY